jgi:ABC-type dipeptide/oligopeptide/nickel transport system permease component
MLRAAQSLNKDQASPMERFCQLVLALLGIEHAQILQHISHFEMLRTQYLLPNGEGSVVGGVLILEEFFNIPGIGAQSLVSVEARDIPVLQATVILATVAIAVANLLTDITYGILDPRIKTT